MTLLLKVLSVRLQKRIINMSNFKKGLKDSSSNFYNKNKGDKKITLFKGGINVPYKSFKVLKNRIKRVYGK